MGVTGLWRLIEPAGKPVPVETLENKVLAVDISIWLHQMVKGYQDAKGAPLANAHLMGLFQRVCKLLYFRIKPVFVFDGSFPDLKKETIAKRQDNKIKYNSESERLKRELALILGKKTAVNSLLGKQISPKKGNSAADASHDDIFKLPALPQREEETESESEDEQDSSGSVIDLHSVDVESDNFKSLPVKEKYELLVELKETRKMNSWGRLHELPKQSNNFSDFQMQRLLKRRKVQVCLEETEKEMGDTGMSLNDLESLLNEEGIETKIDSLPSRRIASNNSTRFLLISSVKQALADAKKKKEAENKAGPSNIVFNKNENTIDNEIKSSENDEQKKDLEKAIKMSLAADNVPPKEKELENDLEKEIIVSLALDDEIQLLKKDELEDDLEKAIKMSLATDDVMTQKKYEQEDGLENAMKILPATNDEIQLLKKDELEEDLEKAIKMSLECVNEGDTSACNSKTDDSWTSVKTDSECTDSEEEDGYEQPNLTSAKAYIMQYSDLTHTAIAELVAKKIGSKKGKSKVPKVDQIIDELYKEKSVIVDNINLSSSDNDDDIQESSDSCNKMNNEQKSVAELNTSEIIENNVDMTQSSVICVENPTQNVITLDTSIEEDEIQNEESNSTPSVKGKTLSESDTDNDEFVEVPEIKKTATPVCEIMLTMDNPPEDDIFADIFDHKKKHLSTEFDVTKDIIHDYVSQACEPKTSTAVKFKVNENASTSKDYQTEIHENLTNEWGFITKDSHLNQQNLLNKEVIGNTKELECVNKIELKNKSFFDNADVIDIARNTVQNTVNIEVNKSTPQYSLFNPETSNAKENVETQIMDNNGKIDKPPKDVMSTEELNTMVDQLQNEEQDLLQEKGRLDRIGRNITEQMTKEAQELLQIFGIPYIVAPTEAEAQCAFLESVNLTDGTITDDSDIWLFGGRTVYKNFFNQKKHVLQFLAERIERSFNLTREQLVLLALLVGSDYTTGVSGVGPVTALEILASFPFNKKQSLKEASKQAQYTQIVAGLHEFKKWVRAGKRTDNTTLKKKLKNVTLTDDFPSIRVIQAYLEPNVEKSEEKFTWGEMDITVLRDYTKAKFGWSQNKLDEIIKPVLKRILDRKSQRSVQDYFKMKIKFQSLEEQMSKRVKAAVQKMGPEQLLEENISPEEQDKTVKRKGNTKGVTVTQTARAAGPKTKKMKSSDEIVLKDLGVKIVSESKVGKSSIEIKIPKSDRVQEFIPQREKDKQSLLQNKMKAIEVFRKTTMDRKRKTAKKRVNLPKEKAELSESSDSN